MATEKELRNDLIKTAKSFMGAKKGSAEHKQLIKIFNKVKPLQEASISETNSESLAEYGMTSIIDGGRMFHIENRSGSATISGNTNGSVNIALPTVADYKPIGIIGISNSHGANFCVTDFTILNATSARVVVRNVGSSSATVTITIKVLYTRSDSASDTNNIHYQLVLLKLR